MGSFYRQLKYKTGMSQIESSKSIFDKVKKLDKLQTNAGSEFLNRHFQVFLTLEGMKKKKLHEGMRGGEGVNGTPLNL